MQINFPAFIFRGWHTFTTPKRPIKRTRDEDVLAKNGVDAILEELEEEPQPAEEKDPRAVQRGQQDGPKGGKRQRG